MGLPHGGCVKERPEREFDLIATSPSADYHVYKTDGTMIEITSPQDLPEATKIDRIDEPYLKAKIIVPPGTVMQLVVDHRGISEDMVCICLISPLEMIFLSILWLSFYLTSF